MSNTTLIKLAAVKPPVGRTYAYLLTRWRWYSTFVMYVILFLLSSLVLMLITQRGYHGFEFYLIESVSLAVICTLAQMVFIRRQLRTFNSAGPSDISEMVGYGRAMAREYGDSLTWEKMCELASEPQPRKGETVPRFEHDYPIELILGGIIDGMIKINGWKSLPVEALNAIYHYPEIYKPFSLNY